MGSWRQLAALPATRHEAAACWHGGKVYLAGGRQVNNGTFQNTLFIYDPTGNTWTTGAVLPATGRAYAFSATDGLHLVYPATGAHYLYDPATNTWATSTTAPVVARLTAHHFVDAAARFYLAGGQSPTGGTVDTVHRYDPATGLWTARANMPTAVAALTPTQAPGVLGADNKAYLGTNGFTTRLAVYDPATDTWTTTTDMPDAVDDAINVAVSRLPSGVVITLPHVNFGGPSSATELMHRIDGYSTSTATWSMGVTPDYPGGAAEAAVATEPGGQVFLLGGLVGDTTTTTAQAWAYKQNEPPTVATLLTMTGGALVSTASTNRARHQFNDPSAGDSQSKFDWRYRKVGDATWITGTEITPNPWHDIAAGTLTPGNYERQVLTYDAASEAAPAYTASGFFTAAAPPAGPSITYPINGQTLDQVEHVDWSTPSQESYQVRRVADNGAGAPDTATVYFDTGEVVDALTRSLPLDFATNGRTEHMQVRVKNGGLWSDWVSVSGAVSYTPPPAPTYTAYPDPSDASLLIMITNPDPGVGEPAAAYNDVYITDPQPDGGVVAEIRQATAVATNSPWRYRTPVGSWDYAGTRIRVVAVAANGTTSSS